MKKEVVYLWVLLAVIGAGLGIIFGWILGFGSFILGAIVGCISGILYPYVDEIVKKTFKPKQKKNE